eukprot:1352489-Amphidinium_carterae.2
MEGFQGFRLGKLCQYSETTSSCIIMLLNCPNFGANKTQSRLATSSAKADLYKHFGPQHQKRSSSSNYFISNSLKESIVQPSKL